MLNISADNRCEKKLRTLIKTQNTVGNLRVVGDDMNADVLGYVNVHYEELYLIYLGYSKFSS